MRLGTCRRTDAEVPESCSGRIVLRTPSGVPLSTTGGGVLLNLSIARRRWLVAGRCSGFSRGDEGGPAGGVGGGSPRTSARTGEGIWLVRWSIAAVWASEGWIPCDQHKPCRPSHLDHATPASPLPGTQDCCSQHNGRVPQQIIMPGCLSGTFQQDPSLGPTCCAWCNKALWEPKCQMCHGFSSHLSRSRTPAPGALSVHRREVRVALSSECSRSPRAGQGRWLAPVAAPLRNPRQGMRSARRASYRRNSSAPTPHAVLSTCCSTHSAGTQTPHSRLPLASGLHGACRC